MQSVRANSKSLPSSYTQINKTQTLNKKTAGTAVVLTALSSSLPIAEAATTTTSIIDEGTKILSNSSLFLLTIPAVSCLSGFFSTKFAETEEQARYLGTTAGAVTAFATSVAVLGAGGMLSTLMTIGVTIEGARWGYRGATGFPARHFGPFLRAFNFV